MYTLKRNQKPLYLCKRYVDEETNVTKYERPEEALYVNWQPISSDSESFIFGIEYSKYIRIKGSKEECSKFNNKDRVYIFKQPDLINFDNMCSDADYEVDGSPLITINDGEVLLKRLSSGEENEVYN